MEDVLGDLAAEQEALDELVADLDDPRWDLPTPAEPWTIRDQISHLAYFDEMAALSATDPAGFATELNTIPEVGIDAYMERPLRKGRSLPPSGLLAWWRSARRDLLVALERCDPDTRVPWYGPPMRARSSAVARLMEAWAHGQDVADALGVRRRPTDRLFRVAGLGVRTFRFSFENRGLEVPGDRVRVTLHGPSGRVEVWNEDAPDSITGPVEDFCLVVAQRRHVADTELLVDGPVATRWMEVAQVFAGPPGPGRTPTGV